MLNAKSFFVSLSLLAVGLPGVASAGVIEPSCICHSYVYVNVAGQPQDPNYPNGFPQNMSGVQRALYLHQRAVSQCSCPTLEAPVCPQGTIDLGYTRKACSGLRVSPSSYCGSELQVDDLGVGCTNPSGGSNPNSAAVQCTVIKSCGAPGL